MAILNEELKMKNEELKEENPLGDFPIDVLRTPRMNLSFAKQNINSFFILHSSFFILHSSFNC